MRPLPVFRLDADVTAAGGAAPCCARFDAAPAGVLVGTQMVAKGHDFPAVTLGVVLDADSTLRFPDFRAEERTFALVAQLAGRSGRGERGGRVIVQALDPAARALRHAAAHDADGFLGGRARAPRGVRLPALRAPGPGRSAPRRSRARSWPRPRRCASAWPRAGVPVLGPAPLFRRRARHRAQLVVRSPERGAGDRRGARGGGGGGGRPRARAAWLRGGRGSAVDARHRSRSDRERRPSRPRSSTEVEERGRASARLDPEAARAPGGRDVVHPPPRRPGPEEPRHAGGPLRRRRCARQVERMAGIMRDAFGVGLAAPQLGISQRLLVYRSARTRR